MSVTINGSAGVTTNSGAVYDGIQSKTAVASTSGTSIDFTSIPSWVKRITVMFQGVSTNGTSNILIQLGTSSGFVTTNYISTSAITTGGTTANSTAGFIVTAGQAATDTNSGIITISLLGTNNWISNGVLKATTSATRYSAGEGAIGGTVTQLRVTTVNGTDAFDAGTINILYE